jgi:hypothetical protein
MEISSKAQLIIDYRMSEIEKNPNGNLINIYEKVGLHKICCRMQININNVKESIVPQK